MNLANSKPIMRKYQNPEIFIIQTMDVFYRRYCVNSTHEKWKEWLTKEEINGLFNLVYAEFIEKVRRGKFTVKARIKTFLHRILCNKIIDKVSKNPAYKSETFLRNQLNPLIGYFFEERFGYSGKDFSTTFKQLLKRLRQEAQGAEQGLKDDMDWLDFILKEGERIMSEQKELTVVMEYEVVKQKVVTKYEKVIEKLQKTIDTQYLSDNVPVITNQLHNLADVEMKNPSHQLSEEDEAKLKFLRKELGEKRYELLLLTKGGGKTHQQAFEKLEQDYTSVGALKKYAFRALTNAKEAHEKYLQTKKKVKVIENLT